MATAHPNPSIHGHAFPSTIASKTSFLTMAIKNESIMILTRRQISKRSLSTSFTYCGILLLLIGSMEEVRADPPHSSSSFFRSSLFSSAAASLASHGDDEYASKKDSLRETSHADHESISKKKSEPPTPSWFRRSNSVSSFDLSHVEDYWADDDDDGTFSSKDSSPLDSFQRDPLLQIPCSLEGLRSKDLRSRMSDEESSCTSVLRPIRTFVDTGAQRTVLTFSGAKRAGLLPHLDRRYAGTATGVAGLSCRILGRLPAGLCQMKLGASYGTETTIPSPAITVIEDQGDELSKSPSGVELLLGLDFLREHKAVIDIGEECLTLTFRREEMTVPFIRPREKFDPRHEVAISDRLSTVLPQKASSPSYSSILLDDDFDGTLKKPSHSPQSSSHQQDDRLHDDSEEEENWSDDGEAYDMSGF